MSLLLAIHLGRHHSPHHFPCHHLGFYCHQYFVWTKDDQENLFTEFLIRRGKFDFIL
jgi:hypothetical protein